MLLLGVAGGSLTVPYFLFSHLLDIPHFPKPLVCPMYLTTGRHYYQFNNKYIFLLGFRLDWIASCF